MKNIKSIICAASIGIMLFAQLMSPVSVYADEGTPPPPETKEVIATSVPTETEQATKEPIATDTPTEVVPPETPVPDSTLIAPATAAPSTDIPVETEVPATDIAETKISQDAKTVEEDTLLEALQEMPADTSIIVKDANDQTLPLATQDAAEVIESADPFWCPDGATATPGVWPCTVSYASLGDLVANESGNIYDNGTIYIEQGTIVETGPVVIDGQSCGWNWDASAQDWYWYCSATNWSNYSLTLQGGWGGSPGSTSNFSVPISILNWNNDVTINDINILNSSQGGLLVTSWNPDTDVHIDHVTVDGAGGYGLGMDINGGDVTIDNSEITHTVSNYNGDTYFPFGDGVDIFYADEITITNSNFSNNAYDGLFAVNSGVIDITDSQLNNNSIGGLDTYYPAQIIVTNTEFTANGDYDVFTTCDSDPTDEIFAGFASLLFADSPAKVTFTITTLNDPCTLVTKNSNTEGQSSSRVPPKRQLGAGRRYSSSGRAKQEFSINCDEQLTYPVKLPNGDKVEVVCPVHGVAAISRLENTALPAPLPAGYTYASAFQLDLSKNKDPLQSIDGIVQTELIPVITEGGYMQASFVPTPLAVGKTFAVLYWDTNTAQWIPLKDFVYGRSFKLFPENPDDARSIRHGVHVVSTPSGLRIEVATNFPGIFVLAQH